MSILRVTNRDGTSFVKGAEIGHPIESTCLIIEDIQLSRSTLTMHSGHFCGPLTAVVICRPVAIDGTTQPGIRITLMDIIEVVEG